MDDDYTLECQLDLMHALQNRPPLRPLSPHSKPVYIGGHKGPDHDEWTARRLSGLQSEFLQTSLAMQQRVRPQLERMEQIREMGLSDDRWRAIQRDLKGKAKVMKEGDTQPRMLFQIEEVLRRQPGWKELQQQVRDSDPHRVLQPVEFDGFYVVRDTSYKESS